jgi:CheY-like chemotaxis protein
MLESTKYQVDTANDGMDACRKMEAADYDAIICDVMMPEMDGPALHEHLRRMHRPEADRMLFITGARMDGEAVHLLHERGCRVLRKPFTADELNAAVDEVAGAA